MNYVFTILIFLAITACSMSNYALTETANEENLEGLVAQCLNSFEKYSEISEKKFDISFDVLEFTEVDNLEDADEFNELWGTMFSPTPDLDFIGNRDDLDFPIVLLAIKMKGHDAEIPKVLICDSQGELTENSRYSILLS